jgi:hypothetical protein
MGERREKVTGRKEKNIAGRRMEEGGWVGRRFSYRTSRFENGMEEEARRKEGGGGTLWCGGVAAREEPF